MIALRNLLTAVYPVLIGGFLLICAWFAPQSDSFKEIEGGLEESETISIVIP